MCAASASLSSFVLARFVQGMGGAMMVPVGRLVILRTTDKADLVRALSYLTVPALLGPVIGPPLGGFISTYFHWRWIFLINIPIGVLGWWLARRHIEDLRDEAVPPLDWVGFALTGVGLSLLMLGLASEGKHLVSTGWSLALGGMGMALLLLYLAHYRKAVHPCWICPYCVCRRFMPVWLAASCSGRHRSDAVSAALDAATGLGL